MKIKIIIACVIAIAVIAGTAGVIINRRAGAAEQTTNAAVNEDAEGKEETAHNQLAYGTVTDSGDRKDETGIQEEQFETSVASALDTEDITEETTKNETASPEEKTTVKIYGGADVPEDDTNETAYTPRYKSDPDVKLTTDALLRPKHIDGMVKSIDGNKIYLLESGKDGKITDDSNEYYVFISGISENQKSGIQAGDYIRVYYNGTIRETYPMQVDAVSIEKAYNTTEN